MRLTFAVTLGSFAAFAVLDSEVRRACSRACCKGAMRRLPRFEQRDFHEHVVSCVYHLIGPPLAIAYLVVWLLRSTRPLTPLSIVQQAADPDAWPLLSYCEHFVLPPLARTTA